MKTVILALTLALVLLTLVGCDSQREPEVSQEELLNQADAANGIYIKALRSAVDLYVSKGASPTDVADAAMAKCHYEGEEARQAFVVYLRGAAIHDKTRAEAQANASWAKMQTEKWGWCKARAIEAMPTKPAP